MAEGNGLSPFTVDMNSLVDLIKIIKYFFRPPKRDLWYNPKNENSTNSSDNGGIEEDAVITIHATQSQIFKRIFSHWF